MKITQAFTFEAAHLLPNVPDGHRCKNMHGHSYRLELELSGAVMQPQGWVVDFFDVEAAARPLLLQLDHAVLNDVHGLENPTAENIATWFWQAIMPRLPDGLGRVAVRVFETPYCWAEFDGT